jgi:hypothetical protein
MTQLELGRRGVQAQVIAVYEKVGCVVARTAQSYRRGSRREPGTPGIPDLYVFPPLRRQQRRAAAAWHPALAHAPFWHETKSEDGKQRPEQREWQERCAACGVAYVLGGVAEAVAHLQRIGLVQGPAKSDPTKPWYLIRDASGDLDLVTQHPRGPVDDVPPEDVVPPEWPAADRCAKKRPHPPHTWGGEGWSPFRCRGAP